MGNRVILSGHEEKGGLDAALFLTAVRAACEEREIDTSVSIQITGELWSKQGHEAAKNFWSRIKKNFPGGMPSSARKKEGSGIDINTVSAARDYAPLWGEMVSNYPNFRSKLVFYPEWLRQTRFGEILYKADVLLKELASGVPGGPQVGCALLRLVVTVFGQGICCQGAAVGERHGNRPTATMAGQPPLVRHRTLSSSRYKSWCEIDAISLTGGPETTICSQGPWICAPA